MSRACWVPLLIIGLAGCGTSAAPTPLAKPTTAKAAAPTRIAPAPERQLGINLSGVVDWSSEWPFVDAFKSSRVWMENGTGPFTYDDHRNPLLRPGQVVETLIFRGLSGHYPAGKYIATYEGAGEVEIKHWDVDAIVKQTPGRIEFRVKPADGGILIRVRASSPRDPIRNIRVWLPGFDPAHSDLFHPLYLERLQPFRVVRFMDWQRTNNSPVFTWSQRSKPEDLRWSTELGVPIEVMCELANAAHVHPWFCLPHQADDEFVREFAKLVKAKLDPELKVHVEYSNEVWNWGFQQAAFASERGKKLELGGAEHLRYYTKRSVEIFDIFTDVFGDNDRLVRVLSGQFVNPSDCEVILKYQEAHRKADAIAVGAYFGYDFGTTKNLEATLRMTPDSLIDRMSEEIDGKHRELVRRHAKIAQKYGLRLLAYEGGQHLSGHAETRDNAKLNQLFMATNRHPRMAELYKKQLDHWFAEGGSTFAAFSFAGQPSKFGSWGVLEYLDQPVEQAPRYRALADFSSEIKP